MFLKSKRSEHYSPDMKYLFDFNINTFSYFFIVSIAFKGYGRFKSTFFS